MDLEAHLRIALAARARDVADSAHALVASVGDQMPTGQRIRMARRLRSEDLNVLDLAVLVEHAAGASWPAIATALSLPVEEAIRRFQPTYDTWVASLLDDDRGEPATGIEHIAGTLVDTDPQGTAESLDSWVERTADPWAERMDRPVSRILA